MNEQTLDQANKIKAEIKQLQGQSDVIVECIKHAETRQQSQLHESEQVMGIRAFYNMNDTYIVSVDCQDVKDFLESLNTKVLIKIKWLENKFKRL